VALRARIHSRAASPHADATSSTAKKAAHSRAGVSGSGNGERATPGKETGTAGTVEGRAPTQRDARAHADQRIQRSADSQERGARRSDGTYGRACRRQIVPEAVRKAVRVLGSEHLPR